MADVLYRKYRSQTFDSLLGQEHITRILKNAVLTDSLSHAYLFVGSRGTGKTSTARILAKAINCEKLTKEGNPCNECNACKSITSGTFLDLIEVDAASNRGIDQIRDLKEKIEFSPTEGKYKIYIIDEVHMLTTEAFNALLKTLEEPPEHVIFMLATTDVHKLPATILSRCQRYDFRLGTEKDVEQLILNVAGDEGVTLSEGALRLLIENSRGSYRDALSLLDVVVSGQAASDKPDEVSENEVRLILGVPDSTMVYYLLENLVNRDPEKALNLIDELDVKGVDLQQFVRYVLNSLRQILVDKMRSREEQSEYGFIKQMSKRDVIKMINLFLDADRKLRSAHLPKLIIEVVVAEICFDDGSGAVSGSDRQGGGNSASPKKESSSSKDSEKPVEKPAAKSGEKKAKAVAESKSEVAEVSQSKEGEKVVSKDSGKDNAESKAAKKSETAVVDPVSQAETKGGNADLSMKDVESKWGEIINRLQQHNGHLYAFLKASKLQGLEKGTVNIEVPFEFHKDRIESPKSREIISSVFADVFGGVLAYRCVVNESAQTKRPVAADVILKSIPKPEPKDAKKADGAKSEGGNGDQKPRKMNKKIEAIFAGL
ncbi:MAG: DNA polymerase III subunit gamma/tau [Candidatus Dojkabacteria bacterium]|nr:MAG: DNA polymerase III subunit gamma/tau [Candidatus Dojkabacteria bacterium]